jgi:hypothetical protein
MRAPSLFLLALALGGCSTAFGDKETDDGSGEGDEDDGSDGSGGTVDDVDDIVDDLDQDTSDCEEVEGQPVPGAVSYFVGSYQDQGDGTWRGTEQWVLIANDRWIETETDLPAAGMCTVTWTVAASESGTTGACAACDLGLDVSATVDLSNTDCPEGLYEDPTEMNWQASYALLTGSDGSADWFYQSSGTPLGVGTNSGGVADYASDKSCKWF